MKKALVFIVLVLIFSSCSNKSAGARVNDRGHGAGFFSGDIFKF